jgi:hypothetical protein
MRLYTDSGDRTQDQAEVVEPQDKYVHPDKTTKPVWLARWLTRQASVRPLGCAISILASHPTLRTAHTVKSYRFIRPHWGCH